jgi:hypothetical protein
MRVWTTLLNSSRAKKCAIPGLPAGNHRPVSWVPSRTLVRSSTASLSQKNNFVSDIGHSLVYIYPLFLPYLLDSSMHALRRRRNSTLCKVRGMSLYKGFLHLRLRKF